MCRTKTLWHIIKENASDLCGVIKYAKEFGIEYKAFVLSAHRVPEKLEETGNVGCL